MRLRTFLKFLTVFLLSAIPVRAQDKTVFFIGNNVTIYNAALNQFGAPSTPGGNTVYLMSVPPASSVCFNFFTQGLVGGTNTIVIALEVTSNQFVGITDGATIDAGQWMAANFSIASGNPITLGSGITTASTVTMNFGTTVQYELCTDVLNNARIALVFGARNLNSTVPITVTAQAMQGWSAYSSYYAANLHGGGGGGSVTSFSAGNLSPLFTTSVATATTTPVLSFALSNAPAFTYFGNSTGSSAPPSFLTNMVLQPTTGVAMSLTGAPDLNDALDINIGENAGHFVPTAGIDIRAVGDANTSSGILIFHTITENSGGGRAGAYNVYELDIGGSNIGTGGPSVGESFTMDDVGASGGSLNLQARSTQVNCLSTDAICDAFVFDAIGAIKNNAVHIISGDLQDDVGNAYFGTNAALPGILHVANPNVGGAYADIENPSTTTEYIFNLPATPGSAGQFLTSQGGGSNSMTWTNPPTGTVTSFSSGNASPLFSTSVATPTTTPAQTFTVSNAAADTVLGNPTGSSAAPVYTTAPVVSTLQSTVATGTAPFIVASTTQVTNLSASSLGGHTFVNPGPIGTTPSTIEATTYAPSSAHILIASTAPTISSGFGTGASIVSNNGPGAFTLNVGTGGTATTGIIGLPTATTGWICNAFDSSTQSAAVSQTRELSTTTTTATIGNFSDLMAASAWASGDVLGISCFAF